MTAQTLTHFTAWLTFDAGCLDQDNANVAILEDTLLTGDGDKDGDWACDAEKSPVFYAITGQDAKEGDMDVAMTEARELMEAAGWSTVGSWQPAGYAYTITVEKTA